jgi:hypothetical protein
MDVVSTRAAAIGMLLMADHGETVEIAVVAVAIGIAATGVSARMDAAVAAVVVGAAVIGISIGDRAAINLPRTRRVAAGARARDVEKVRGDATGIGAIPVGATATALRAAVVTVTVARAIAPRAAVVTVTVARAVATSIAKPIVRVTSTVAAAMLVNPVSPSVRMSKLIVPSIRRQR